jgi:serine/threonine-protein kinase
VPDAEALLGEAGLSVGEVISEPSETTAEGIVIGTEPQVGAEVPAGSSVTLFVSSGPTVGE